VLAPRSFLPSEELTDEEAEASQGGPESEEILFVFARAAEEGEEAAAEEEQEEEEEQEVRLVLGCAFVIRGVLSTPSSAKQLLLQQCCSG
jgi:hypothetical protein